MSQAKGSNTTIVVGIEPSYGSISSSFGSNKKAIVIPYASCNIKNAENQASPPLIRPVRNPIRPSRGNKNPGGTLNTLLTPHMYTLLAYTLGKRKVVDSYSSPQTIVNNVEGFTTTGENAAAIVNETAPYTHTFVIGDTPSFTLEEQILGLGTPQYRRFLGCRMNEMNFSLKTDGFVDLSFGIAAAEETTAASAMSTGNDLEYSTRAFESFELAAASIKLGNTIGGATAIAAITDIRFTLRNGLGLDSYVIGGLGVRKDLPPGVAEITGSLRALFSDTSGADTKTLVSDINAGIEKAIDLKFRRGSSTEGTVDNESLQILIPELMFASTSPVIDGPAGVFVELNFMAYYENATINSQTSAVQFVLMNSDAPRL